jgi:ribulose-5-phosphate 4-epimerase/fuculose-1-phosphate aldolase
MIMPKDSYIKFHCQWLKDKPTPATKIKKINHWRNKLFAYGLIGSYSQGIGYGNISVRLEKTNNFLITGSATGQFKKLTSRHYTKVIDYNFKANYLTCRGPIQASSESLTHAAIYQSVPAVKAVIHIHSLRLWKKLLYKIPTTAKKVAYGTPAMAWEMTRLLKLPSAKKKKIIALAGHREGLVAFGKNLDEAGQVILGQLKSNKQN